MTWLVAAPRWGSAFRSWVEKIGAAGTEVLVDRYFLKNCAAIVAAVGTGVGFSV